MSRRKVPVPKLLTELGIKAKREGRLWKALCPNPAHDDHDPSWSIIDDDGLRHGSHWCHACGFGGGPWELVAAVRDLTLEEAGRWLWTNVVSGDLRALEDRDVPVLRVAPPKLSRVRAGMAMPPGVSIPSVDGSEWHPRAWSYLTAPIEEGGRGVPEWQVVRWHIGFATRGTLAWRIFVPVYTRGMLLSYVARAFIDDGRVRYRAGERAVPGCLPDVALWGEPGFDREVRCAVVTEGVFKGLAMERAGAPNPCAILGANNLGPEKIQMLSEFDALLIATDPDQAGDRCAEKLSDLVARYTEPVRMRLSLSPDDATDEENGRAWREAMTRAAPAIRARRLARLGASS